MRCEFYLYGQMRERAGSTQKMHLLLGVIAVGGMLLRGRGGCGPAVDRPGNVLAASGPRLVSLLPGCGVAGGAPLRPAPVGGWHFLRLLLV